MNGTPTPSRASRSATLVWVNAPGLKMTNSTPSRLRGVDRVDELVLGIALQGQQFMTQGSGAGCELRVDLL